MRAGRVGIAYTVRRHGSKTRRVAERGDGVLGSAGGVRQRDTDAGARVVTGPQRRAVARGACSAARAVAGVWPDAGCPSGDLEGFADADADVDIGADIGADFGAGRACPG